MLAGQDNAFYATGFSGGDLRAFWSGVPGLLAAGAEGRPGLLPPLGVDFETALGALLKTPPPLKGEAADKAKKRKAGGKK